MPQNTALYRFTIRDDTTTVICPESPQLDCGDRRHIMVGLSRYFSVVSQSDDRHLRLRMVSVRGAGQSFQRLPNVIEGYLTDLQGDPILARVEGRLNGAPSKFKLILTADRLHPGFPMSNGSRSPVATEEIRP